MKANIIAAAAWVVAVIGHGDQAGQFPIAGPHKSLWYNTLPGDGGTQVLIARALS
jgi:agmatinase